MFNKVTLRTGSRLHILVPWNSVSGARNFPELFAGAAQAENAPAVFLPINRG